MHVIATAPGDRVNNTTYRAPKLGREAVGKDLKLLHGIL